MPTSAATVRFTGMCWLGNAGDGDGVTSRVLPTCSE